MGAICVAALAALCLVCVTANVHPGGPATAPALRIQGASGKSIFPASAMTLRGGMGRMTARRDAEESDDESEDAMSTEEEDEEEQEESESEEEDEEEVDTKRSRRASVKPSSRRARHDEQEESEEETAEETESAEDDEEESEDEEMQDEASSEDEDRRRRHKTEEDEESETETTDEDESASDDTKADDEDETAEDTGSVVDETESGDDETDDEMAADDDEDAYGAPRRLTYDGPESREMTVARTGHSNLALKAKGEGDMVLVERDEHADSLLSGLEFLRSRHAEHGSPKSFCDVALEVPARAFHTHSTQHGLEAHPSPEAMLRQRS